MRKKRRSPLFVLIFMAFLLAFKCIEYMDKYSIRPIVAILLVSFGMLVGVIIFSSVQLAKEKNKGENPDKLS